MTLNVVNNIDELLKDVAKAKLLYKRGHYWEYGVELGIMAEIAT